MATLRDIKRRIKAVQSTAGDRLIGVYAPLDAAMVEVMRAYLAEGGPS